MMNGLKKIRTLLTPIGHNHSVLMNIGAGKPQDNKLISLKVPSLGNWIVTILHLMVHVQQMLNVQRKVQYVLQ